MFFSYIMESHLMHAINPTHHELFVADLERLDETSIVVEGKEMKPSQCYHIGLDPVHVLYNQNCPDSVKDKIDEILRKYRYK